MCYGKSKFKNARNLNLSDCNLTAKGQITIPKTIRDALKVRAEDCIEFLLGDDGRVTIFVSFIVLCELVWVLEDSQRQNRAQIMNPGAITQNRATTH
ncbi:MAG: type II toxin-antitoxin system PrlF family antitoxin [Gammaproteobacteria bacterium]